MTDGQRRAIESQLVQIANDFRNHELTFDEVNRNRTKAISDAHRKGMTLRHIASLTNLSHQRVAQIINSVSN